MKIQAKDFVTLDYTGIIKDTGKVFDTTNEDTAKKEGFYSSGEKYQPITLIVGENQIIKGLDKSLAGREEGDSYEITVQADEGFGSRKKELIKLIPKKYFKQHNINPVPGFAISVDGLQGMIRTVTGGRIIVDFNHPLSGRELEYKVIIRKILQDPLEKAKELITYYTRVKNPEMTLEQGTLKVSIKTELPKFVHDRITGMIRSNIKEIKKVDYHQKVSNTQPKKP